MYHEEQAPFTDILCHIVFFQLWITGRSPGTARVHPGQCLVFALCLPRVPGQVSALFLHSSCTPRAALLSYCNEIDWGGLLPHVLQSARDMGGENRVINIAKRARTW